MTTSAFDFGTPPPRLVLANRAWQRPRRPSRRFLRASAGRSVHLVSTMGRLCVGYGRANSDGRIAGADRQFGVPNSGVPTAEAPPVTSAQCAWFIWCRLKQAWIEL
jgi:hypothetical protein